MDSRQIIEPVNADEPEIQYSDNMLPADDALRERDEQYRVLIDFCPDAIYIHDGDRILFANPTMVTLLGAESEDDVVGAPVMAHTPEKYRKIVQERHKLILESEMTAGRNEQQYLRRDGSSVEVVVQGTPVTFNQKPAILVIARDVSDQKKSERMLRDAIDSIPEGFSLYDADDRLALINENFFKGREGLREFVKVGMTFEEQCRIREKNGARQKGYASDRFDVATRVKRHQNPQGAFDVKLDDGRSLQINEFKTKNGGTAILRTDITELKDAQEELRKGHDELELRVAERTRDLEQEIVERKAVEDALLASEIRMTDILTAAADRFWETDADHRYTFYSPPRSDLKLPSDNFIGHRPWDIGFRDPGPGNWDNLKSLFESKEPFRDFKYSRTREDGKLFT